LPHLHRMALFTISRNLVFFSFRRISHCNHRPIEETTYAHLRISLRQVRKSLRRACHGRPGPKSPLPFLRIARNRKNPVGNRRNFYRKIVFGIRLRIKLRERIRVRGRWRRMLSSCGMKNEVSGQSSAVSGQVSTGTAGKAVGSADR
jgi:hypothetical protein